MPRYFFHLLESDEVTDDPDGRVLPDLEAARLVAIADARAIMSDEMQSGHLCLGCCIVIVSDAGVELSRVAFREAVDLTGL